MDRYPRSIERARDRGQRPGDQPPFCKRLVGAPGEVERHPGKLDRRRARQKDECGLSLGQLCAAVVYHYKLSPCAVSEFSGSQLILWYERARIERGEEKLMDLQLFISPHTKDPEQTVRDLQHA